VYVSITHQAEDKQNNNAGTQAGMSQTKIQHVIILISNNDTHTHKHKYKIAKADEMMGGWFRISPALLHLIIIIIICAAAHAESCLLISSSIVFNRKSSGVYANKTPRAVQCVQVNEWMLELMRSRAAHPSCLCP